MPSFFVNSSLEGSSPKESTSNAAPEEDEHSPSSAHPADVPKLNRVRSTESQSTENFSRSFPDSQSQTKPVDAKDMLVVSLLESKAVNDILQFLNENRDLRTQRPYSRHDPKVQALAKEKYTLMCNELSKYGILDSNVHRPEYRPVRDLVNRAIEEATRQHNARLRDMGLNGMTSSSANVFYSDDAPVELLPENQLVIRNPAIAHDRSPLFSHPLFNSTEPLEYLAEIGRGGYGRVYRARNLLDSGFYAVKRIPLSQSRLQRIVGRGMDELDALLKEVRTMQRLDHPHIVRYHGAWVEYKPSNEKIPKRIGDGTTTDTGSETGSQPTESQSAIFPMSLEDDGIVFGDDSNSDSTQELDDSPTSRPRRGSYADSVSDDFVAPNCIYRDAESSSDASKSTSASHEMEEEVETIPRDDMAKLTSRMSSHKLTQEDDTESKSKPPFEYVLCIQMGLYPMNLAEYLSSDTAVHSDSSVEARHCFHVDVSLKILLAILDAVRYLHASNLVHRDLKPANIFVCPRETKYKSKTDVFLEECQGCKAAGIVNKSQLGIYIGDFGLVTDIAQLGEEVPPNVPAKVVGTEFYRPPTPAARPNEKLDVFALGVIGFELLWPFDTGMERAHTLMRLKQGEISTRFAEKVGARISILISHMVSSDEDLRPTCEAVQEELESIISSLET